MAEQQKQRHSVFVCVIYVVAVLFHSQEAFQYKRAVRTRSFLSGVKDDGNSMLNSMMRSPFCVGSEDIGIPSVGTIFL